MSSASKIRAVLLAKGANISRRIVSRRLNIDFSVKSRKPAKKQADTGHESQAFGFAQKHVNWTIQQWHQVLFF